MKKPIYFEVKLYLETGVYHYEGGILYADSWDDAAKQIHEIYQDDLVSMSIEMFDEYDFIFPLKKAREIKSLIKNEE